MRQENMQITLCWLAPGGSQSIFPLSSVFFCCEKLRQRVPFTCFVRCLPMHFLFLGLFAHCCIFITEHCQCANVNGITKRRNSFSCFCPYKPKPESHFLRGWMSGPCHWSWSLRGLRWGCQWMHPSRKGLVQLQKEDPVIPSDPQIHPDLYSQFTLVFHYTPGMEHFHLFKCLFIYLHFLWRLRKRHLLNIRSSPNLHKSQDDTRLKSGMWNSKPESPMWPIETWAISTP